MKQFDLIVRLFTEAEKQNIPLWLESGWAVDFRLGTLTREHSDIDIAFPQHLETGYLKLLKSFGFEETEKMEYGYLHRHNGILIDSSRCVLNEDQYILENFPFDACPMEKEGRLNDFPVRCVTWRFMYSEFLFYKKEVPLSEWRDYDHESLEIIRNNLTSAEITAVEEWFNNRDKQN